jgi:hypothetical protein
MRTTVERVIGERVFTIGQLGARQAVKLFPLVAKAGKSFANITGDEMVDLTNGLIATVLVDGKPLPGIFETEMQGKMSQVLQLLGECIEVNYGDFSEGGPAVDPATQAGPPSAG